MAYDHLARGRIKLELALYEEWYMPSTYRVMGVGTFRLGETETFKEFMECPVESCTVFSRINKDTETKVNIGGIDYNVRGCLGFVCSNGHMTGNRLIDAALSTLVEKLQDVFDSAKPKNMRFSFYAHTAKPIVYAVLSSHVYRVRNEAGSMRYVDDQEFKALVTSGSTEKLVTTVKNPYIYTFKRHVEYGG